jgi:hypothetical protein
MLLYTNRIYFGVFLLLTVLLMIQSNSARGQDCTTKTRKYATRQHDFSAALLGLGGSLSNDNNAVDGNVQNASTLSFLLGALGLTYAEQVIDFNTAAATSSYGTLISGTTPITIKFALPTNLLSVLGGIEIQPIKNLRRDGSGGLFDPYVWKYDNVGTAISGSGLNVLGLLNGSGEVEITFKPGVDYHGIRMRLSSTLGVSGTAKLYGAYITESSATGNACSANLDVLSGVRAGTVVGGIANATGSVTDPRKAIDNDPETPAIMDIGLQVASELYLTSVFNKNTQAGDAVKMIIEKPSYGLLSLNILNGFTIQLYNEATPVGDPLTSSSSGLLSLSLLPGAPMGSNKRQLLIKVPKDYGIYDRVEIKMGGVAGLDLTAGLRVYDVKRIILPQPTIDGITANSKTICEGQSTTLSINDFQDCTMYNWYTVSSGGTPVHTTKTAYSPNSSLLTPGVKTFYVEATRTNCTETSGRIPVTITVNPAPSITPGNGIVCLGATNCNVPYTNPLESPTTYSILWNTQATAAGWAAITDAALTPLELLVPVPATAAPGTYTGTITVSKGTCPSTPKSFSISINTKLPTPNLIFQSNP